MAYISNGIRLSYVVSDLNKIGEMNICVVVCQRFASELNIEKVRIWFWMNVNHLRIKLISCQN